MKRVLFAVIATIFSMAVANAQEVNNPKHIFGVSVGVNFSKPSLTSDVFEDMTNKFGLGFHIGGTYDIAMSKSHKWYFQTGLNVKYNSAKAETFHEGIYHSSGEYNIYNNKYKALYLEIPAMFSRKIRISNNWGFQPAIGLSYALGIWGKCNEENTKYEHDEAVGTTSEKLDLFSSDVLNGGANWTRSVINGKLAVNFTYKNYLIGADVAYGFNGDLWGIGLSVGYNF